MESILKEKTSQLIEKYIDAMKECFADDSQIIDELTEIYSEKELIDFGYGSFVKEYFQAR